MEETTTQDLRAMSPAELRAWAEGRFEGGATPWKEGDLVLVDAEDIMDQPGFLPAGQDPNPQRPHQWSAAARKLARRAKKKG